MSTNRFLDYDSIIRYKKLYVFGSVFQDVLKLIDSINDINPTWDFCGFIGNPSINLVVPSGYKVFSEQEIMYMLKNNQEIYIVNNSDLNNKELLWSFNRLVAYGCKLCNLIHPNIDMNMVKIGTGCILPDGCIIGGNSKIGNNVVCDYKTLISHDVYIEDNVLIGMGACIGGRAFIRKGCVIGIGSIIMGEKIINEGSIVGAGAVVTKNVKPYTVVTGIPAKPTKRGIYE